MRILGYSHKDSGCGYHRVFLALGYLTKIQDITGYVSNYITDEKLSEGWDIFLFNRISHFDNDWNKIKGLGIKVVMDIDDDWTLPPNHINHDEYKQMSARIESNLLNADLVTVTHERLANKVIEFNSNVVVIPNGLPFGEMQYTSDKIPCNDIRLFWAGGISHANDIEILRNPMKRISSIKGIQTVIGGYSNANEHSKQVWDRMVSSFTNGLRIPGAVLTSLPTNEYMNHFSHADIMLLPLEKTEWHSMKSNLKLLEAACKGIPVICSKVLPYTQHYPPVLWVEKQSDWFKHVNDLVNDKAMREDYGKRLIEWAEQFDLRIISKKRLLCYQNLLAH